MNLMNYLHIVWEYKESSFNVKKPFYNAPQEENTRKIQTTGYDNF